MPTDGRHQPTRRLLLTLLLLCGAGAYLSGEAVSRQANLWTTGHANSGVLQRICHATAAWGLDCAARSQTPWSRFNLPIPVPSATGLIALHRVEIPVSFVGLAYFVFLGSWFLFVARTDLRMAPRWPVYITRIGVLFSVGCLGLMILRMAPACALCILVHGLNIVLAVAVAKLYRPLDSPVLGDVVVQQRFARRQALCAGCFAAILIMGLWLHRREQLALGQRLQAYEPIRALVADLRADPDFLRWEHHRQPQWVAGDEARFEDTHGSRLTVFTDFQCPSCACADQRIERLAAPSFSGHLLVEVRHFPLDSACNDTVTDARHPQACEAAYAAEAARMQGGAEAFTRMKELLFAARKSLHSDIYAELAQQAGLDVERFQSDLKGKQVRAIVQRDVAMAKRLGVSGTPTLFLNGRKVTEFGLDNPLYWRTMADDWFAEHETTRIGAAH